MWCFVIVAVSLFLGLSQFAIVSANQAMAIYRLTSDHLVELCELRYRARSKSSMGARFDMPLKLMVRVCLACAKDSLHTKFGDGLRTAE
jgi:cyanate lyase